MVEEYERYTADLFIHNWMEVTVGLVDYPSYTPVTFDPEPIFILPNPKKAPFAMILDEAFFNSKVSYAVGAELGIVSLPHIATIGYRLLLRWRDKF